MANPVSAWRDRVVGLLIRTRAGETPAFAAAQPGTSPLTQSDALVGLVLKAFMFTLFWSIAFYFFLSYMPTFARRQLQMPESSAIWVNTFMLAVYIAAVSCAGLASDRFGRTPVLMQAASALRCCATPWRNRASHSTCWPSSCLLSHWPCILSWLPRPSPRCSRPGIGRKERP
jgi:MFS family permease